MGIAGKIVALAIAVAILYMVYSNVSTQANQWWQTVVQGATISQLAPKPHAGQDVCKIEMTVYGQLDNPNPFALNIYLGRQNYHPEVADWKFFDCVKAPTGLSFYPMPALSLMSMKQNETLPLDSFAVGNGGSFHVQLVFLGEDGSKVDASVQPLLLQSVATPNGGFYTPYSFQVTFVATGMPLQNYHVQIFAGRPINDLATGTPYDYYIKTS